VELKTHSSLAKEIYREEGEESNPSKMRGTT